MLVEGTKHMVPFVVRFFLGSVTGNVQDMTQRSAPAGGITPRNRIMGWCCAIDKYQRSLILIVSVSDFKTIFKQRLFGQPTFDLTKDIIRIAQKAPDFTGRAPMGVGNAVCIFLKPKYRGGHLRGWLGHANAMWTRPLLRPGPCPPNRPVLSGPMI